MVFIGNPVDDQDGPELQPAGGRTSRPAFLGRTAEFPRHGRSRAGKILLSVHVPLPQRPAAHGPRAQLQHRRCGQSVTSACRARTSCHPWAGMPFGLPAENAAIKNKVAAGGSGPTENIDYMRGQLQRLGLRLRLGPGTGHLQPRNIIAGNSGSSGPSCLKKAWFIASNPAPWSTGDPHDHDRTGQRAGH